MRPLLRPSPFSPGKAPGVPICGWPGDAAALAGKGFPFQLLLPSGEIKRRGLDQLVELKNVKLVSDELSNRFSEGRSATVFPLERKHFLICHTMETPRGG